MKLRKEVNKLKISTVNKIVLGLFILFCSVFAIDRTLESSNYRLLESNVSSEGGTDYMFRSLSSLEDYYEDKYTSTSYKYIDSSEVSDSRESIYVADVSQSSMNSYYLAEESIQVTNTCAIVAISSLINYYEDQNLLDSYNNGNSVGEWFVRTMNIALANNLTTATSGTTLSKVDNIITFVLNSLQLNTTLSGDNEYANIYSKIQSNIGEDVPALFHIPLHSTLARGYLQYEVTVSEKYWSWFTYKWREVDIIEKVLIINEGWYNSGYSYYPVELISDGFLNTGPYCMTEII